MKRFRRILVVPVTAGHEPPAALHEAVALAALSGAELHMLGHLDEPVPPEGGGPTPEETLLIREAQRSSYMERLRGWADQVGAADLPIEVTSGSQPVEVSRRVERDGHDLVIVAADESAESATASSRILRTCPTAVWLLRQNALGTRVLAAIDPEHDPETNRLILELAHSQAELHGGELRVAHAWDVPGLELLDRPGAPLDREQLSRIITATEAEHRSSLDRAIASAGLPGEPTTHVVEGPAPRAIQNLANFYRSDLIVMGAGAMAQPDLGLGKVAEQVLSEIHCSALIVRQPAAAQHA